MAKQGTIHLKLLDAEGRPLPDRVDIELRHQFLSDLKVARDVDGSKTIKIDGLHQMPQGLYKLLVRPRQFRVTQQFVNVKSSGVTEVEMPIGPRATDGEAGYKPRIVVKFKDFVELPYEDAIEPEVERLQIGPWSQIGKEFPGATLRRMFTSLPEERIRELMDRAREMDPDQSAPSLLSYYMVDCPPGVDPQTLADAFLRWETVETAYFDPPGSEPQVSPADDPRFANQGYLDPAPDGIDAEFVWPRAGGAGFAGGDGAGLRVIDLERGWTFGHEDLAAQGATLLHGSIRDGSRAHGTAVLGEICAVDNALGGIGITPHVTSVDAVSYWGSNRPDAILAAVDRLSFGDILLIEAQVPLGIWLLPIEALLAEFDALRLATALGIVVVEAAGNGGHDLDTYTDGSGTAILNRAAAGFRDSGAIMVGAATSATPHSRCDFPTWGSNYGSRIDCYAWGENVDTTYSSPGPNPPPSTTAYTSAFNGTSSASPIITGAALAVQGMALASLGYRFSPHQMRALLSDPATGTASANAAVDRIGVMPNLRAIAEGDVLNLAHDVYIRDYVGDVGDPHTGAISASPDVILRPVAVPDPQAAFGQGSGTENLSSLGYVAEAGQDNYLYVRVRNRGGSDAANVTADVYWSPVASLVAPNLWHLVDSTTIANVPAGDLLTVSGAITWPAAAIPATGHYCLVAIIGTDADPPPGPGDFIDWQHFRRFIQENNNVTWRNFNVVDNEPDPDSADPDFVALPFVVPGAADRARQMGLEVVARLPRGAKLVLDAPRHFVDLMRERSPYVVFDEEAGRARVPLNPRGRRVLGPGLLKAKSTADVRLLVHVPEEARKADYQVFVRQTSEGEEVGRLTWRLAPRGWRDPCDPGLPVS